MPALTSTVQEIFDRCRSVYLNDPDGRVFTNSKLVPILKAAYDDLQTEYIANDLSTLDKVASPVTILAPATSYGTLPSDFIWPIKLEERASGSSNLYSPMSQLKFVNNITPDTALNYWQFMGDVINFPAATTNREVLLYYKKIYPDFPDGTGDPVIDKSTSVLGHSISAMSARIGELVQRFQLQNTTLADLCNKEWEGNVFSVVNEYVKRAQAIPARPRPFRTFWRLGGYWPRG